MGGALLPPSLRLSSPSPPPSFMSGGAVRGEGGRGGGAPGGGAGAGVFPQAPKETATPHDRRQGEACGSGDTRPSLRSSFRRGGGRRGAGGAGPPAGRAPG